MTFGIVAGILSRRQKTGRYISPCQRYSRSSRHFSDQTNLTDQLGARFVNFISHPYKYTARCSHKMDVSVDVSGDMNVPPTGSKGSAAAANSATGGIQLGSKINLSSITSKLPTSLSQIFKQIRDNLRPISEFLNVNNFKKPSSVQRLTNRLTRNLSYFQSNYTCVFIIFMAYCLITSPLILIVLAGVFYACHHVRQMNAQFTIFGRPLNTSQQCLIINCMGAPILYIVGAGAALFWTLGASLFFIILHASSYNIDAIVTEDMEGFLTEVV